jgi:hypothetical protein
VNVVVGMPLDGVTEPDVSVGAVFVTVGPDVDEVVVLR